MNQTLYQKTTKGKITEWNMAIKGHVITVVWGQRGSDKRQTKITKVKAKAHTSAKEQALVEYQRELKKRKKRGYYKTIKEAQNVNYGEDIDLDNIPTSFSPAKPIQQKPVLNPEDSPRKHILNKPLQKLFEDGKLWFQRKANGIRAYYVKTKKGCKLYSRTMVEMSDHFPEFMQYMKDVHDEYIPYNSMLDMELTIDGGYTFDHCMLAQSLAPGDKSKATDVQENALQAQKRFKEMVGCLRAIVFDVIYWDGECVNRKEYQKRYNILEEVFSPEEDSHSLLIQVCVPWNFKDFEYATEIMTDQKWEGLVIWDQTMKGGFTVNGKPKRLKGCWKWKNVKEDDFFVIDLEPEKGNDELVGALIVGQYDENGNIINCGRVGSGLKKEDKPVAWNWVGRVFEIHFDHRMKENGAGQRCLQFPRIIRERTDKPKSGCILEE